MTQRDVLVREPPAPRHPRLLRALAVALVVAAVLGAAGTWAAGRYRAPQESAALDRCVAEAETTVQLAETRLGAMARYVSPALGAVSAELDSDLYALIGTQAADLRGSVAATLERCRDVALWPTSLARRRVRAAHVMLLEAEVARLRAVATDGRAYYERYDEVYRLRQRARDVASGS